MYTREEWLTDAAVMCLHHINTNTGIYENGVDMPLLAVSCGFPGGRSASGKNAAIGQCWSSQASAAGRTEIFISPTISDPIVVLATLLHEVIHAVVGLECGHKGEFKRVAIACGLEGKMTATVASEALKSVLATWVSHLGEYPHAQLTPSASGIKKQSTRLIKVECPSCGYTVRTTQKWLQVGVPTCVCGTDMIAAGNEESEGE